MTRDASRPRRSLPALATLTAVAAAALSGCSWMSPAQTLHPYSAGDGVHASLGPVQVNNLAVVATAAGSQGVVTGQVSNQGDQPVELTIAGPDGTGTIAKTIPAHGILDLQQADAVLTSVKAAPGAMEELTLSTPAAGTHPTNVPVLAATGIYATVTPSAAASSAPATVAPATPATTPAATPSASATH